MILSYTVSMAEEKKAELISYDGVLWNSNFYGNDEWYEPLCPEHKLVLVSATGAIEPGRNRNIKCRIDNKVFSLSRTVQENSNLISDIRQSDSLKNATILELDNVYTPRLRVEPKPKDKRYSIQIEIDETPQGKKMVIYASDRKNPSEKTQIFIDPEADKITFDSKNDIHPNMIFSKVEAYFKDGRKATLEQDEGNHGEKK